MERASKPQRQAYFEQFEQHAEARPAAIAVECGGESASYGELNRRANRIAHALLAGRDGAAADEPWIVGLVLEPGIDYCAALLGTGKAGAAFLPLPPELPPRRLADHLEKSRCRQLVGDEALLARLEESTAAGRTLLDATAAGHPEHNPGITVGPGDPAYVMFTSGSTGTPKAILGQQRGLAHFLRWESGEFGLGAETRCAALAPLTFDVSLRDILVPLTVGGTLCIPDAETRRLPHRLAEWIAAGAVTLLHCVPTVLRLLTRELERRAATGEASSLPSLRRVLVAGEPLLAADVAGWRAAAGEGCEVVNLYGPTETTLAKAFQRIGELPAEPHQVLPIGTPLPNTALLILSDGRLCATGEIGEIHIRTPYRSLGYLNDPELTAAAFIQNPLATDDKPDPVYRTGDLGRYRADGSVECLGRRDGQVKINGVRIELAEVETALRALPAVADGVAVVHQSTPGDKVLVAYYVRADGDDRPLAVEELLAALGETLPEGLLPRLFVALKALPTTITGKVNRRALPPPEELFYRQHTYTAPAGATEERLAAIWREQFGIARVGVTTTFQAFGGDSLKAIRVVLEIYRQLGVDIGLKEFFADSTIRALAALIDQGGGQAAVAIPRIPDAADYPASPAQRRLWRLHRMGIAPTAYNLAEAFRIAGPLDGDALAAALAAIVQRHESLRTRFREVDGEVRQVVDAQSDWRLERIDLSEAVDPLAEAQRLAAENHNHHFDLERGPLLRAQLLRLPARADGAADHVLLFNIHHIVSDVWSLGVLVRELGAAYDALRAGTTPPLAPLTLQQRDILAWREARRAEPAAAAEGEYWHHQLGGELPLLELPADRPRPAVQTFNGGTRRLRFEPALCARLDALAEARASTRFALLGALVNTLLHRYSGQRDLILGTPVAGRDHPELEPQIGCYINTLALRTRLDPELTFEELLSRFDATVKEGLAHHNYPFDALVSELDTRRDMSRSPLFDVMLVVQGFGEIAVELAGTTVEPFGRENAWNFSRYDLVFHFEEKGGEWLLDLNYNADLFDPVRIDRMAEHLRELARSAERAPQSALAALPLLPAAEAARIAEFSAGPSRPFDGEESIGERFRAVAARFPERPALIAEGQTLDYRQLDTASDRLAAALAADGVRPGERVAVLARRSVEAVTALLGILKAGAVYVPIDPDYPGARIARMVERAGCVRVVLERAADAERLPETAVPARLFSELSASAVGERPAVSGDEVAYIIFTSGSTGEPKAVMVEHRGFNNMSLEQIRTFGLDEHDRVLQFASPSFDASLANLFQALFAGGAVVLPAPGSIESVPRFLEQLERTGTTCVTLPPTYLRTLQRPALKGLRVLITAGESAPVEELRHYAATRRVFNAYGPTEASVCATVHEVTTETETGPLQRLPIGRPLANTTLQILDGRMQPVPLGVPGEIFLGGIGLARGFQGEPERTAERFIHHPESGERLYRTGDLGRWLEDGSVDFLGRDDDQLKIAGHRIEPMEVEEALRGLEGIDDAHVMPHRRGDGSLALAAYFRSTPRLELWPSIAEFFVYDHVTYSSMAGDEARNARYRDAFARHLPGRTVVDIGTGPFAILARLAIEAGARKVYAVDLLEETARRARQTVEELGLGDRIEVIHGNALEVELPEPVDYCISEIVGAIGGSEGSARIINGVRRLLKEPANMLPQRSLTRVAAVSLPTHALTAGFPEIAAHYVERIFDQVGHPFDLRVCVKNLPREAIISDAGPFEDLDYTRDTPLEASHEVELTVTRPAALSGLLVWLDLHVDGDHHVDILDSPGSWLPVYLPLFEEGAEVIAGDRLRFTVERTLCGNGLNPDFTVHGIVERPGREPRRFQRRSAHFGDGFRTTPFYRELFPREGVPRADGPTPLTVRRDLARRLPSHALPAYLTAVERIPLTVNGKVDRDALPAPAAPAATASAAPAPQPSPRPGGLEGRIVAIWEQVLERAGLGAEDDFFALGGDSIRAIQIVSRLHREGYQAEIQDIFQNPTPAQLAAAVRPLRDRAPQEAVVGAGVLSPIQRWFFERVTAQPHHFNQAVLLRAHAGIDAQAAEAALHALWRHHDALRTRFAGEPPTPVVAAADAAGPQLRRWAPSADATGDTLEQAAQQLHAGFDLANGPLIGALLAGGNDPRQLLLVAHHLVVDAVSWGILVEDFVTAYEQSLEGSPIELPAKTHAYRDHAGSLAALAAEIDWAPRLHYWRGVEPAEPLTSDGGQPPLCAGRMEQLTAHLAETLTVELLGPATRAYGATTEELLLAALGLALERTLGRRRTLVTLEGHGREVPLPDARRGTTPDVSRTVGWFTNFYPFPLESVAGEELGAAVQRVREALARVPDRGRTYGLMTREPAGPRHPGLEGQVGFNYLGRMGGGEHPANGRFSVDWDAPGTPLSPDTPRPHALDLLAMVVDGRLEVALDYDTARFSEERARSLLRGYLEALEELLEQCRSTGSGRAPASGFTYRGLSEEQLDDLLLGD
ncbi:amino acid adenylation domain-containing protein [Endothiovibrio diazotrophicus]